jgi:two-component system sporulation sensor kinase A
MLSKYEFIVNNSKEFMTIINKNYQYEAVNRAYAEAIDKPVPEIIGKKVQDIWGGRQFKKIIEPNIITAFEGKEIHYQSWFSFPLSKRRFYDVAYYPYQDETGEVTHLVIITRDITQQKEMENQLQQADKLAAVGDLSTGIAHEIRNPLAIMKSTAQYVKKHYHELSAEKLEKTMDVFVETADRINKTILDLLEFTKPQSLYQTEKNIVEIVRKTLQIMAEQYETHQIKIEFTAAKNDIYLRLDEHQVQNALMHLLANAIEAQPNGGSITIHIKEDDETVKLTIADKGEGIEETNLTKVFNPFFSTKTNSSGLGLSLVYQIIKEHDGTVDIKSNINEGTTVTVKFVKFREKNA